MPNSKLLPRSLKIPSIILFVLIEFSVANSLHVSNFCVMHCCKLDWCDNFDFSGELDLDELDESDADLDDESEEDNLEEVDYDDLEVNGPFLASDA